MPTQGHWTAFADLQESNDPSSVDQSLGREEALDKVLDEVVANPSISEERIYRRFGSLSRNRRSKYCHRRNLEQNRARPSCRRGSRYFGSSSPQTVAPDLLEQVARADLVRLVRSVLPEDDFGLLWEIAEGTSYRDAARARAISVASLKALVFKIRERVRTCAVGQVLRAAIVEQVH